MRFLRRALVGLFLMSLTLALLGWSAAIVRDAVVARMNEEPRGFPQRERVLTVNTVTVEVGTMRPELVVFGEIQARRSLDVRTTVGGTVAEVAEVFVDGGAVAEGDLLLRVDPAEASDQVARAEADLADAQAEVRDAERALALGRDELAAAEAQVELRERALTRQQDLQARGIGTAPELEAAELALSSAEQAVLSRRQSIAQAEARVDQGATRLIRAEIAVGEARRALEGTEVRAAFDGLLADVAVITGGRVTANEQIARLIDPLALEVAFRISTSQYVALLDVGGGLIDAELRVSLDVEGLSLTATGRITREAPVVSEGQTGRLIFAALDAAAGLRPGDFVTVTVSEPPLDGVARLPATALAADGTVLVIGEDERLSLAEVELIRRQGNDVIVRPGEALIGREVVAERSPLLGPGIKVRPAVPAGAQAETQDLAATEPEMIELDAERRAQLIAAVEENQRIPPEAKTRVIAQLNQPMVPAAVVSRIEDGRGG